MTEGKDPMGHAIADFHATGKAARLRVFSPMFDEDEIPVTTLFRGYDEMPAIEQEAVFIAWKGIVYRLFTRFPMPIVAEASTP